MEPAPPIDPLRSVQPLAGGLGYRRILIVDDHPVFAAALAASLAFRLPLAEITMVHTLAGCLAALPAEGELPLILFDLNLPDCRGVGGLRELRRVAPEATVIVVSAEESPAMLEAVAAHRVQSVISKRASVDEFLGALDEVLRTAPMRREVRPIEALMPGFGLTPKQYDVLVELARGRSNKEIARNLCIGVETVKTHVSVVLRNLGVGSRAEAIAAFAHSRSATTADAG